MPAFQKRTAQTVSGYSEPKKAKKTVVEDLDPVQAKVASITSALQDDTFEVAGPKSNRAMLIAMAPSLLATPQDKRHAHMESMIDTFKEVFANEEGRLQQKVVEAQATVAEASTEISSRKAEVESAASALQVKVDELKGTQTTLAADVHVTRSAEATFKDVEFDLSMMEETKSDLAQEQSVAQEKMESFSMFKEGNQEENSAPMEEHNLLKALATFLKKIKADASLVAALPMALGRKPAERSEFDAMTVVELEKKLEEKLRDIAARVHENKEAIEEKTASKATTESALVEAKQKQRVGAEALLAVKAAQKQLTANLSLKQQAVIEQEFVLKGSESDLDEKKVFLKAHQVTQSTLIELIERVTPVEPVVQEVSEVPVVEAVEEVVMEEVAAEAAAVPETVPDLAM